MTGPRRPRRRGPLLVAALGLALAPGLAGCGGEDLTDEVAAEVTEAPATTAAAVETTAEPRLRDADVLDRDTLIAQMTEGTTGDPEWIEIFAALRVESWLLIRYPEAADPLTVYTQEWLDQTEDSLIQQLLDAGQYVDEPLPRLISVRKTDEIGELVELEVELEGGRVTLRSLDDDQAEGGWDGNLARGLFLLGRDGEDEWRIDSVAELQAVDQPDTEETTP